jgi:hypothetical protein
MKDDFACEMIVRLHFGVRAVQCKYCYQLLSVPDFKYEITQYNETGPGILMSLEYLPGSVGR